MTTPAQPQAAIETLIAEMRVEALTDAEWERVWAFEAILTALAQDREQLQCKVNMNAAAAVVENERANALQAALSAEREARQQAERELRIADNTIAAQGRQLTASERARAQAEMAHEQAVTAFNTLQGRLWAAEAQLTAAQARETQRHHPNCTYHPAFSAWKCDPRCKRTK